MPSSESKQNQLWLAFDKFQKLIDTHRAADYKAVNYLTALIFLRLFIEKWRYQLEKLSDDNSNYQRIAERGVHCEDLDWQSIASITRSTELIPHCLNLIKVFAELTGNQNYFELKELLFSLGILELEKDQDLFRQLVEIVSKIEIGNTHSDEIFEITEELIANFADATGEKGGEFYTPKNLAELLVKILNPPSTYQRIFDPACGTGGLLLAVHKHIKAKKVENDIQQQVDLFGQDINSRSVSLARINLLLHNVSNSTIAVGDSLLQNAVGDKFDLILTNPPIGLRHDKSTLELLRQHGNISFRYGAPTRIADANFVQLVLSRLAENGRAALLIGLRLLMMSTNQEAEIKRKLVEADVIEAVITLPNNVLPHTNAQPAILVINKSKPSELQEKILFIYADKEFKDSKPRRVIEKENQDRILQAYLGKEDQKHFSALVNISKIRESNYTLLPANYVGINEITFSFGDNTEWIKIENLAQVTQGTPLSKLPYGETPILQGRDLGKRDVSVEDLDKKAIPAQPFKIIYSQKGDILAKRIGGRAKFLLIEEQLAGIPVGDTAFIIRFNQVNLELGRYLTEFLNSDSGQIHLSASITGATVKGISINSLRRLEVPIPSQAVTEFVVNLHQLENRLYEQLKKVDLLKQKLFSAEDEKKFDLRGWSIEAQVLSESVLQSDDFRFQIRNAFPHVLAYPYRNLNAMAEDDAGIYYKEQLRIVENLLAYLGAIGLALISSTNSEIDGDKASLTLTTLREAWRGGISPGHWQDIGRRSAQLLRNNQQLPGVTSFVNLWFKGNGSKQSDFANLLKELISLKNDFKHDRSPHTKYEYRGHIRELTDKLEKAFKEIAFFVKYPMHFVQSIDYDWRTKEFLLTTLVYAGDHPGLRVEKIRTSKPLSKDRLYLELSHDSFVPLHPLISVQYCEDCRTQETYFIDKWEGGSGSIVLKSFERGHTHINSEIAKQVSKDFNEWLQNLPLLNENLNS